MKGGGVLLYVHNTYKAKILCTSTTIQKKGKALISEYIMCSVQRGSWPPVFVAVIYRPPDAELINSDLAVALKRHSVGFVHRIVMRDLNANMLLTEPEAIWIFDTWIDLICFDDNDIVLDANNMVATFPNRHNMIDVTIDIPTTIKPTLRKFTYRNFKGIRQEKFLYLLKDYD